jgi:group I intron endonuclease
MAKLALSMEICVRDICIIYKHTNKFNNKAYIGQTWETMDKRAGKNGIRYENSTYFWNAIQKNGWDSFIHEIVCYGFDQQDADYWEQHFIDRYDTCNPEKGYNLRAGGSHGKHSEISKQKLSKIGKDRPHTEEHKNNISLAKKGKSGKPHTVKSKKKLSDANTGENNHFYGRKHSEEAKMKISLSKIGKTSPKKGKPGKPCSEETKSKISLSNMGRASGNKGKKTGKPSYNSKKFSQEQIDFIISSDLSLQKLADIFNCSTTPIRKIKTPTYRINRKDRKGK